MRKPKRITFDTAKLTKREIDALNEDWIKVVGWDFWVPEPGGGRRKVTTLRDMFRLLGFDPQRISPADLPFLKDAVARFERMPAALGMPKPLHDQWVRLLDILGIEPSPYRKAAMIEW